MNEINLLREQLRAHLPWHGARLSFVAMFLMALIRVRTVDFSQLAVAFGGNTLVESSYKRIQRFFRGFDVDEVAIAKALVAILDIPEPWVLSVDRTEWQFGQSVFNILVLGVVHQGIAIPLVWTLLEKRGNSNTLERMDLMGRFLEHFGEANVAYLCGDREFVGQLWFSYLKAAPETPFRMRIKCNHQLFDGRRSLSVKTIFADLQPGQQRILRKKRRLWGHWLYIAALRLDDGSLLVIATQTAPQSAIADYAQRWGIETLFGMLKTRGFRLEDTHLRDSERLGKLFALLSLALAWAVHIGYWMHEFEPIEIKNHGRKARSIFRYGLDHLRSIMLDLQHKNAQFLHALEFLSCT
ncbi:MAG: IS4 family transposase [Synechococcus sp.]